MTTQAMIITKNVMLLLAMSGFELLHSQATTATVTDPRPIAAAIEQLEAGYAVPITYEDPIVVNDSRLEDVSNKAQKIPDPSHPVIIQKDSTIVFTYKVLLNDVNQNNKETAADKQRESAVNDALTSILSGYRTSGGPETFGINEENGIFHVVPKNYLAKSGALQELPPILDRKITIVPKRRTRPELVREICNSLSQATGIHVGLGTFPNQGEETDTPTTISGADVTARTLLDQLLNELSTPVFKDLSFQGGDGQTISRHSIVWGGGLMSWELYYSPGWGYVLNIYQVAVTQ